MKRKILATFVALALVVGIAPTSVIAAPASTDPIGVRVWVQTDTSGFKLAEKYLLVSPGLSEQYGYTDDGKGARTTVLDALVAANIALYGADKATIDSKLEVPPSGFITKVFGENTSNFTYAINGAAPNDGNYTPDTYNGGTSALGYSVTQAFIEQNDKITFNIMQDDWGMDLICWFEQDDTKVTSLTADVDEEIELTLQAYMGWYSYSDSDFQASNTGPVEDAGVVNVIQDDVSDEWAFDGTVVVEQTDEDGAVSFSFGTPGVYYISVPNEGGYFDLLGDDYPLISPWLVVKVGGAGSDTTAPTLSAGAVSRTGAATATIALSSNEAGKYYCASAEVGSTVFPAFVTGAGVNLGTSTQTISLTNLASSTAKDVYIVGKDATGNISNALKITVPAWTHNAWGSDGKYYVDNKFVTGVKNIDGKTYFFDANGAKKTGVQKDGTKTYYLGTDGVAKTGWQKVGGKNYYFDKTSAVAKTGKVKIGKATYYFDKNGKLVTGLKKIGKAYYYFKASKSTKAGATGKMATGWQKIGKARYYFKSNGKATVGKAKIKGKTYSFAKNGKLKK